MVSDPDPANFLDACETIDYRATELAEAAEMLAAEGEIATARRCFEFVRDQIRHSSDFELNPVTCRASDVLLHRTGYCYAKSHLLVALLRANKIPAGLCYQRLTIGGEQGPYCLHGLVAVHLSSYGWYRVDPRGNRDDVNAQFSPPDEMLAFPICHAGERDLPEIHVHPLGNVVRCLTKNDTWDAVLRKLPDVSAPSS